jgi:exopolyphosphatase / guanosine-5'-triphosphate,3'-diphosphate pyrophosphatase
MPCFAAIDVGSSAIRLSVVKLSPVGVVVDTDYHRYGVRLGADVFAAGKIRPAQVRTLLDVFSEIADLLRDHHVERYRAVATSAVRDAKNGRAVVERIRRHTGLNIEIIDGQVEARLSRDALCRALGSVPDDTLLVDLGGGSLQLYRAGGGFCRSLPLGTVRLIRNYPNLLRSLSRHDLQEIGGAIERDLRRHLQPRKTPLAIGTGGNLDALARLVPARGGFYPAIAIEALADGVAQLAAVSPSERIDKFDLRPDRADVIIPSALTILAVARLFKVKRFIVPGTGLRDGIVQALAAQAVVEPPLKLLRRRFGRDMPAVLPVIDMADRLFGLFKPVHHLWPQARVILKTAAGLRDLGTAVDPIAPYGHSARIIESLAGLGMDRRSQEVVAWVVARGSAELGSLPETLPADERPAEILAGLLRLAVVLVEARARLPRIDFSNHAVVLDAALRRRVPKAATSTLATALGIKIRLA